MRFRTEKCQCIVRTSQGKASRMALKATAAAGKPSLSGWARAYSMNIRSTCVVVVSGSGCTKPCPSILIGEYSVLLNCVYETPTLRHI